MNKQDLAFNNTQGLILFVKIYAIKLDNLYHSV